VNSSTSSSKRFFIGFLATFLFGVVAFVIGSEMIVRTIVAPKSEFDALRSRLHTSEAAYGAFADSHGANGLRPRSGFENFSMAGDNLVTIVEKAKFFAKLSTAKGVIVQADPHHFASYRLNRDQTLLRDDLFSLEDAWLQFLRPVYRQYLLEYWQTLIERSLSPTPMEGTPHAIRRFSDVSLAERTKAASIRAGQQTPLKTIENSAFAHAYQNAIAGLRQAGIQICLVTFPVSAAYREISQAEPAYAHALLYYKILAQDSGAAYFDFSSAFEDNMFSDPDHLNAEGAQMLTDITLKNCFGTNG